MPFKLDEETQLTSLGDGHYSCPVSDFFWNMDNAFGGWAVALAVKAVEAEQQTSASLSSITAQFIQAIPSGNLMLSVRTIRQSSRTGFFRVEFHIHDLGGPVIFTADIVMSDRSPTDLEYHAPLPDMPAPETLDPAKFDGGPRWFPHYDQRRVSGESFTIADTPRNLLWIRDGDGRPLDAMGLACISDTLVPRTFLMSEEQRFSSTVSYSLYMFARQEELAQIGNDYLVLEGFSDCVRNGGSDQKGLIWSRNGDILATTTQISFFR